MNLFLTTLLVAIGTSVLAQAPQRPLFREFVGLCGHTEQFKPELYQPVCRVVRDYHPVKWDLGKDTSVMPEWPFAKNRVSWEQVYRGWHDKGLSISVCLQFDDIKAEDWKDIERDAQAYAKGFAEHFGPGGKYPFVDTVEIGNEPGHIDDATYLRILKAMAAGIHEGNPKLKPAFYACSGITRNFQPKPSYHAIAWMLKHLADYRFSKAILKSEKDGYLFKFTPEKPDAPKILAAWHATRENVSLDLQGATILRSEIMPLTAGNAVEPQLKTIDTTVIAGTPPILL
jgi:hypothetical protein